MQKNEPRGIDKRSSKAKAKGQNKLWPYNLQWQQLTDRRSMFNVEKYLV